MNHWSDRLCPNGCMTRVYQYAPGGRWFERNDVPHTCPATPAALPEPTKEA